MAIKYRFFGVVIAFPRELAKKVYLVELVKTALNFDRIFGPVASGQKHF